MPSLLACVLVASGGALGALARFLLARWVGGVLDTRFPLGTFVINVSGSFLLGAIGTIAADRVTPNADTLRLALGVGFLGAFTTFSTFEFETSALLDDGSWITATANVVLSVAAGLVAVRAGMGAVRSWLG